MEDDFIRDGAVKQLRDQEVGCLFTRMPKSPNMTLVQERNTVSHVFKSLMTDI